MAGSAQKSAAKKAAAAQTAADQAAIAQQQQQYQQTRTDLAPWMQAGQSALGGQGDLLGLNGAGPQQSSIDALKASPLYASLFGNGQEALLANASATGGLRGGNLQGASMNFGRDTLSAVIQNQLANLGGVSQQGQNAAAQVGNFGANAANNISGALQSTGQAQAGAALATGAANAGMITGAASAIGSLAGNTNVQQWAGKLF
ncbi:hypothetical protein HNO88_000309 [Novosphingobium chloroacetimidivorans]|uniref:DNA transfer protein n=1 Tax=Novosphingobium chloroacetimidivorans TaxID=1428314 RepID=A0A7W7K686_9SPHN|nr:hypothetical protein [Novosphingobium chloroacetimidivorans]MBB4857012.1 hypothetical protein [Novosphingobium chloroacetimidivorans]